MPPGILAALIALLSAAVLALINAGISAKAGMDGTLRSERLNVYPALWSKTKVVSRWPREPLTREALGDLHDGLRTWYYETGGLYLSEAARARYGDVQELIEALVTDATSAPEDVLGAAGYEELMQTCSALRTALTEDLDTRRRKSLRVKWLRARWHAQAAREAARRISNAKARTESFLRPA